MVNGLPDKSGKRDDGKGLERQHRDHDMEVGAGMNENHHQPTVTTTTTRTTSALRQPTGVIVRRGVSP
ncbi:MAG: hypothetical protein ACREJU_07995 [Nitrospiraceae bacterium]